MCGEKRNQKEKTTKTQRRAAKGGEVGLNGETYPGGAFICTTEKPKCEKRKASTRKQNVEPYKWEIAPADDLHAIFSMVGSQAEYIDRYAPEKGITPLKAGTNYYGEIRWGHNVTDLCEAYNRGERWIKAKYEPADENPHH